jgi:demethylmenaquinone methyltransferase/2-methoxy-6-polyprenyl-1,4-benzoquinol methylase
MSDYYDGIAKGYDELHGEEQLKKLELIGREIHTDPELKDFIKSPYKLLDVGCGTGISTGFFKTQEKHGIDPSTNLINIARKNYPLCEFAVGRAEKLLDKDKQFDIVISLTAIQNFNDIEKGLDEIRRVGRNHFILTFLKKSPKHGLIDELIKEKFNVIKKIEEDKDIICFCT